MTFRAKRGYIKGKRYDAGGRVVATQDSPISGLGGAISAKEMEKMLMDTADDTGASYDDCVIEYYEPGDEVRETNPMFDGHSERGTRLNSLAGQDAYDRIFGAESTSDRMRRKKITR